MLALFFRLATEEEMRMVDGMRFHCPSVDCWLRPDDSAGHLQFQSGLYRHPRGGSGLEFFALDVSYVEKLRSGDAHIEAHFVIHFSELIRLKLRSRLNSKEAVEDVRQETFMRVLTLLRTEGGLRQPDRLGPFVNSVCNLVLQEHYRSQNRIETTIDHEMVATVAGREPIGFSLLEAKDTERVVCQILNQLPERDRRLLQSVLLEERNKDEVCAKMGITREYLRVLLHRANHSFKSFYMSSLGAR
jgi:RNA polymerase sigma-70 factor (ECF subfamily)